jgi:pantoate--beta-alanine ligase
MGAGLVPTRVLSTIAELRHWRASATSPIGFVPTMGALHQGHLSLVRQARVENCQVVVSIFVNPTQFGPSEDFQHYPRDLQRDLRLLEEAQADVVFTPAVEEMYPTGAATIVEVESISKVLEGASRPGHFRGVATVVCTLFHMVHPDRAYFGEKDYQQLQVIRRMVRDLRMQVEVVGCPTIRELDGLAMSSRNVYLQPPQRRAAVTISQALFQAQRMAAEGMREVCQLEAAVQHLLDQEPLIRIDYVAVVHHETLRPITHLEMDGAVLCVAVWIGKTRLIDNIRLRLNRRLGPAPG